MKKKKMRINDKFTELAGNKEKALIGFITAGYPWIEDTVEIARTLIDSGVDILELGMPFSDPVADGPIIQKTSEESLRNGMNTDIYFETAKKIEGIPKIAFTYYNIVLQRGLERFVKDCLESGMRGIIIPDLPIEESGPLQEVCERYDVDLIYIAAPTTTEARMEKILENSRGFLYVVSRLGVTGARDEVSSQVKPLLSRIRGHGIKIPLAVGFGISKPEHVREVISSGADGAIIGSAFMKIIDANKTDSERMHSELREFTTGVKKATKL